MITAAARTRAARSQRQDLPPEHPQASQQQEAKTRSSNHTTASTSLPPSASSSQRSSSRRQGHKRASVRSQESRGVLAEEVSVSKSKQEVAEPSSTKSEKSKKREEEDKAQPTRKARSKQTQPPTNESLFINVVPLCDYKKLRELFMTDDSSQTTMTLQFPTNRYS